MLKRILSLSLLAAVALAGPAQAATPLALSAAVDSAAGASPVLKAIDQAIAAAKARATAAGAWPNPSLVSQVQLSPVGSNNMVTVGFRQPLDFRRLSDKRRAYAAEEVEILLIERRRRESLVRAKATESYYRLWLAGEALRQRGLDVAFLEGEYNREKRRVEAGVMPGHELVHVEYELLSAKQAQRAAQHLVDRMTSGLNLLLGHPADTAIAMPPFEAEKMPAALPPLNDFLQEALANRLELSQTAIAIRKESRAIELAESLRFGDGEIDLEGGTAANTDPLLYGAFNLPVPLWYGREGEIAAAQAETSKLKAERVALEQEIQQEVADAYLATSQSAERSRDVRERLLPLAEHTMEKAVARLKAGVGTPSELLAARKTDLDAHSELLQASLEYHLAQLRLERSVGR